MKKYSISFKQVALPISVVALIISGTFMSCNNPTKPEDTKKVAEEHNDAKFNAVSNEKDAQFLVNAAEINSEEINLGKLAQEKSKNAEVKKLGAALEAEHVKMNMTLSLLASKKQITLPMTVTNKTMDDSTTLSKKSGMAFDNAYCDMMVAGHKNAVAAFEKASAECTDVDIKNFAANSLTMLRMHLDKAIVCQKNCAKMKM